MKTIDIFRVANLLIKYQGNEALSKAFKRAAELRVSGDDAGSDVWLSISNAIIWLNTDCPVHGETRQ